MKTVRRRPAAKPAKAPPTMNKQANALSGQNLTAASFPRTKPSRTRNPRPMAESVVPT